MTTHFFQVDPVVTPSIAAHVTAHAMSIIITGKPPTKADRLKFWNHTRISAITTYTQSGLSADDTEVMSHCWANFMTERLNARVAGLRAAGAGQCGNA